MMSELQAILGPELQPMLLANGAVALFAISLILTVVFANPAARSTSERLALRA